MGSSKKTSAGTASATIKIQTAGYFQSLPEATYKLYF
jgi:hypothetical protein